MIKMTSSHNDSVMSFDLDYLQDSLNSADINNKKECHKCQPYIKLIKAKVKKTSRKVAANRELVETIKSTSKALVASKEESKQYCINYNNVLEKSEHLENDIKALQLHNQQLLHKLSDVETQYCGMQSLAKQLEVLAKEREIQIESLTVEYNLEKANSKKNASNASSLQKRYKNILRDLCKISKFLMGNHQLPISVREVLNKYSKHIKDDEENDRDQSDNAIVYDKNLKFLKSPHDAQNAEDQTSAIEIQDMISVNLGSTEKENTSNYEMDQYSECSNEIASGDTGRGSSLAFSDSDKCLLFSPDSYLTDYHGSPEMISKVSKASSPLRVIETMDIATSPLRIETLTIPIVTLDKAVGPDEPIETRISAIVTMDKLVGSNEPIETCSSATVTIDKAVGPNEPIETRTSAITTDKAVGLDESIETSNIAVVTMDIAIGPNKSIETRTIPIVTIDKTVGLDECINIENERSHQNGYSREIRSGPTDITASIQFGKDVEEHQVKNIREKECLQIDYSDHYNGNNEVEMILEKMRFDRELITPIPSSPSISRYSVTSEIFGSQTDPSEIIRMSKDIHMLKAGHAEMLQTIAVLKEKLLNANVMDTSEPNQSSMFRSENIERRQEILKDNSYTDETRETHNNNDKERDKRQNDSAVSVQLQTENETDSDGLIEMSDLIELSNNDNMPVDDFSMMNDRDLVNDEDITDTLEIDSQSQDPINTTEEQDNPSGGIISRLEFEEDAVYALPPQPSDLNNKNRESSEKTTVVDDYLPAKKQPSCNDKIKRKICKLNNLEKLRRKMVPQCKIQREKLLTKRPRVPKHIGNCSRRLIVKPPNKKINSADSSASLNDKTVYDNAVRIMAEFKSKRSREPIRKPVLKSNRAKKVKNLRLLKPKLAEICHTSVKKQSDTTGLTLKKRCTESIDKPFDVSEILSTISQKPIIKSLLKINSPRKSTENNNCIDLSKVQNKMSLKLMQPVILVDRLQEKREDVQEIQCDKSMRSDNINIAKSPSPNINTRSRGRCFETAQDVNVNPYITEDISPKNNNRKRLKRNSFDDNLDIGRKRSLRSSTRPPNIDENLSSQIITDNFVDSANNDKTHSLPTPKDYSFDNTLVTTQKAIDHNISISYGDLDMFDEIENENSNRADIMPDNPKNSILCTMIAEHCLNKINFFPKKRPDHIINAICKLIEDNLETISKLPSSDTRKAMDDFVEKLMAWKWKDFMVAFLKYLQDPQRKVEMYSKVNSPPAPPMTKSEQILLYVIKKLKTIWFEVDIVDSMLCQIEYILFKINQTPEFDAIESMSHFYAVVCRCFGMKIRLRSFMLDAMYCLQYKAIAVVKQCIEVWMHVLPLAHIGIAKNPLVTCMVYLLHYYKCEDNFNRVQEIRNILHHKYFYDVSVWNENRILEIVKNSIYEAIGKPEEKKILDRALLILAKRHGPRWCQKNIIMNMLIPIIENKDSSENVKLFCIRMLGRLMKPYPADMKVHCEIIMNTLLDIAKQNPSPAMQEAVIMSLIYMSKHNQTRVISALLSWQPKHKMSPELYTVLRDYVREKPAHAWKKALSKAYSARSEDTSDAGVQDLQHVPRSRRIQGCANKDKLTETRSATKVAGWVGRRDGYS